MRLTIELTEEESQRLRNVADALRVTPSEWPRAALADLLARPEGDFQQAAECVLSKNHEMYKRLA